MEEWLLRNGGVIRHTYDGIGSSEMNGSGSCGTVKNIRKMGKERM